MTQRQEMLEKLLANRSSVSWGFGEKMLPTEVDAIAEILCLAAQADAPDVRDQKHRDAVLPSKGVAFNNASVDQTDREGGFNAARMYYPEEFATQTYTQLADKIEYAISTDGKVTLFDSHGKLAMAALRKAAALLSRGRWRHKKRGTTYEVLGDARVQTEKPLVDMDTVRVYRDVHDGSLSVRPPAEFEDGRFEAISPKLT
jgi:hypothetical protein